MWAQNMFTSGPWHPFWYLKMSWIPFYVYHCRSHNFVVCNIGWWNYDLYVANIRHWLLVTNVDHHMIISRILCIHWLNICENLHYSYISKNYPWPFPSMCYTALCRLQRSSTVNSGCENSLHKKASFPPQQLQAFKIEHSVPIFRGSSP